MTIAEVAPVALSMEETPYEKWQAVVKEVLAPVVAGLARRYDKKLSLRLMQETRRAFDDGYVHAAFELVERRECPLVDTLPAWLGWARSVLDVFTDESSVMRFEAVQKDERFAASEDRLTAHDPFSDGHFADPLVFTAFRDDNAIMEKLIEAIDKDGRFAMFQP